MESNFIDFNSVNIVGVDGGERGGIYISTLNDTAPMPLIKYIKKPRVDEVLKEKNKGFTKKQPVLIKSGKNKGRVKTRKIINETKDYYINIKTLINYNLRGADIVVLEKAGHSHSASSLRKQSENIEAIRIAVRILDIDLVEVSAIRWKEWFALDDDKQKCIDYANSRQSKMHFASSQDGEAEAYLIYLWFKEFYQSLEIGKKYNYVARKVGKNYKTIKVELLSINYLVATVKNTSGYEFDIRIEDLNEIKNAKDTK